MLQFSAQALLQLYVRALLQPNVRANSSGTQRDAAEPLRDELRGELGDHRGHQRDRLRAPAAAS